MKRYIKSTRENKQQVIAELTSYSDTYLDKAAEKVTQLIKKGEIESFEYFDLINSFDVTDRALEIIAEKLGAVPDASLISRSNEYVLRIVCPPDLAISAADDSDGKYKRPQTVAREYLHAYESVVKSSYSKYLKNGRNLTPDDYAELRMDEMHQLQDITDEDKFKDFVAHAVSATYHRNKKKFR